MRSYSQLWANINKEEAFDWGRLEKNDVFNFFLSYLDFSTLFSIIPYVSKSMRERLWAENKNARGNSNVLTYKYQTNLVGVKEIFSQLSTGVQNAVIRGDVDFLDAERMRMPPYLVSRIDNETLSLSQARKLQQRLFTNTYFVDRFSFEFGEFDTSVFNNFPFEYFYILSCELMRLVDDQRFNQIFRELFLITSPDAPEFATNKERRMALVDEMINQELPAKEQVTRQQLDDHFGNTYDALLRWKLLLSLAAYHAREKGLVTRKDIFTLPIAQLTMKIVNANLTDEAQVNDELILYRTTDVMLLVSMNAIYVSEQRLLKIVCHEQDLVSALLTNAGIDAFSMRNKFGRETTIEDIFYRCFERQSGREEYPLDEWYERMYEQLPPYREPGGCFYTIPHINFSVAKQLLQKGFIGSFNVRADCRVITTRAFLNAASYVKLSFLYSNAFLECIMARKLDYLKAREMDGAVLAKEVFRLRQQASLGETPVVVSSLPNEDQYKLLLMKFNFFAARYGCYWSFRSAWDFPRLGSAALQKQYLNVANELVTIAENYQNMLENRMPKVGLLRFLPDLEIPGSGKLRRVDRIAKLKSHMFEVDTFVKEKLDKRKPIVASVKQEILLAIADRVKEVHQSILNITNHYLATLVREQDYIKEGQVNDNKCSEEFVTVSELKDILAEQGNSYQQLIDFAEKFKFIKQNQTFLQHRDPAWQRYIANILSVLMVLPAIYRIVNSYRAYHTCRFWQSEGQKLVGYIDKQLEAVPEIRCA